MSTETSESMGTKPLPEHEWLKSLLGEWTSRSEMIMGPDQPPMVSEGRETVRDLGGLWSVAEGHATMPDGSSMTYYSVLGFDVSFKEYRGCWYASASSHLWKYTGTLSPDNRTMTLLCEGPNMEVDGATAMYRDVIELIDENTRTLTSSGQQPDGSWVQFMKVVFTRA